VTASLQCRVPRANNNFLHHRFIPSNSPQKKRPLNVRLVDAFLWGSCWNYSGNVTSCCWHAAPGIGMMWSQTRIVNSLLRSEWTGMCKAHSVGPKGKTMGISQKNIESRRDGTCISPGVAPKGKSGVQGLLPMSENTPSYRYVTFVWPRISPAGLHPGRYACRPCGTQHPFRYIPIVSPFGPTLWALHMPVHSDLSD
jgi:hypothetical protein